MDDKEGRKMRIEIIADGGSIPNPGQMYGSYSLTLDGIEAFKVSRMPLGTGTNNEAEFLILVEAIHKAIELMTTAGIDPALADVQILTDSTIVRNRVSLRKTDGRKPDESALRMAALAQKCVLPLLRFKSYRIDWHPRDRNVEIFGH